MKSSLIKISLAMLAVVFTLAAAITPAAADIYYPWCASYGGADGAGVPVCAFTTQQQCMMSVSGSQGFCQHNWPPR